ncbi:MAG: hypothetical protein EOO68_39235 [Moraxellaceae bacterium]|nr:MAG: hypothetical protein EOO68_39235 [Moraxellaceae bacterium]
MKSTSLPQINMFKTKKEIVFKSLTELYSTANKENNKRVKVLEFHPALQSGRVDPRDPLDP